MVAKGRSADTRGELNGHAKLSKADVLAIRESTEPSSVLAKKYSIRREYVWIVRTNKQWTHIQ
jgi:hypothetical protein